MKVLGDKHMPLVMLKNTKPGHHGLHLAVLEEKSIFGSGHDRYVKIKNSDQNEPTIEAKLDLSPNKNGWSLLGTACFFIKFD